MSNFEILSR